MRLDGFNITSYLNSVRFKACVDSERKAATGSCQRRARISMMTWRTSLPEIGGGSCILHHWRIWQRARVRGSKREPWVESIHLFVVCVICTDASLEGAMDALVTGACSRPAMAGLAGAMVPASCSASPGAAMARLPALRASAGSKSRNWRVQAARQPWMALQRSSFLASGMDSAFFDGGVAVSSWAGDSVGVCGGGGGALGAQMNLFERVGRIFRSYANAVVSAAEDPEKLLDQTVLEMQEDLGKMRQASAQVLASQKLLDNKYKAAAQTAEDWYRRAKLALEKGEEDLAREALKRRKEYEESSKALKAQLEQQKGVVDKLIANTRLLESKIQEAKSKKDTLKARAQSAKTSQKVNEMLGSVNTSSALAAFEKMEEKVLALEAQSESLDQLTTDDLSGKFSRLELDTVDDDLAALKRDVLGTSKSSGVLPEGRSPVGSSRESSAYPFKDFEIDKELNELRRKANEL